MVKSKVNIAGSKVQRVVYQEYSTSRGKKTRAEVVPSLSKSVGSSQSKHISPSKAAVPSNQISQDIDDFDNHIDAGELLSVFKSKVSW